MMPDWLIYLMPWLSILLFVTAVGACIGSLINVLVYRMPRGLDVVVPTSRCPSCDHKLTWRENIPIFGWLLLGGKCRFCKAKISPEYPIVETIVAILFGGIWALWYLVPDDSIFWLGQIAPEWAANGPALTWPAMLVMLVLVACLVAMTIIDARTSMIPLSLTWVPAGVALVVHTGHAVWFDQKYGNPGYIEQMPGLWNVPNAHFKWISAPGEVWTLATGGLNGWKFIGFGIGGVLGLGVSNLMLRLGWITRSFADFDAWYEKHHKAKSESNEQSKNDQSEEDSPAESEQLGTPESGPTPEFEPATTTPEQADKDQPESGVEDWLMYPHARREMVRELAFLCPPIVLAMVGSWAMMQFVTAQYGPGTEIRGTGQVISSANAPLWLVVLGGVLMGYLIAGGVVWAVRIAGSLAFGKEAMGLGDVHMMAAVGACLGWIDPTIAFFLAAFVGLAYAIVAHVFRGKLNRAMPYGPFLAIATMMVVLGKPVIEILLGRIFGMDVPLSLP